MEIRQIYYVLEVAKQKNFSKAANSLYVSQSNISQQISTLEKELGVTLFERDWHSVKLTSEGARFCIKAEKVVKALDDLMLDFKQNPSSDKVKFNIALFPFSQKVGVADMIRNFFTSEANTLGRFYVMDNYEAYRGLGNNSIDFAIIKSTDNNKSSQFKYIQLKEEDFVALVDEESAYKGKNELDAEGLSNFPVLTAAPGTHVYDDIKDLYDKCGARFDPYPASTMDPNLITEMIKKGYCITFASKSVADALSTSGIKAVSLSPPVKYYTFLVYRTNQSTDGIYGKFIDYVTKGFNLI